MARRRARRSSGFRPTGYPNIYELDNGRFRAVFKRVSRGERREVRRVHPTLAQARAWLAAQEREYLAALPKIACAACGDVFTQERPGRYCSLSCREDAARAASRVRSRERRRSTPDTYVEKNITLENGKYRVRVGVGRHFERGTEPTLEAARELRDALLRSQSINRARRCPECGTAFRAQSAARVYCSLKCGEQARRKGRIVQPARTKKARQKKRTLERKAAREATEAAT